MARLFQSPQAIQDFDDIWFYIAQDNPPAADCFIDLLLEKALALSMDPLIGRARPDLAPDLRSFPVKAYMLYYRPISDGIELVRILHSSRDVEAGPLKDI